MRPASTSPNGRDHYIAGEAREVARYYFPVLDMNGHEVALEEAAYGGPCGVWVDRNGRPTVELQPSRHRLSVTLVSHQLCYLLDRY